MFLYADTQIIAESMLEDINSILDAGEVPNLMRPEDMEEIGKAMRPLLQVRKPYHMLHRFSFFEDLCCRDLHLAFKRIREYNWGNCFAFKFVSRTLLTELQILSFWHTVIYV